MDGLYWKTLLKLDNLEVSLFLETPTFFKIDSHFAMSFFRRIEREKYFIGGETNVFFGEGVGN